jgi:hypothetical protein
MYPAVAGRVSPFPHANAGGPPGLPFQTGLWGVLHPAPAGGRVTEVSGTFGTSCLRAEADPD